MDDGTKKIILTLGAGLLKKAGIAIGMAAATHGWIAGNDVELFGAAAVAIGAGGYSFWNDYGKAIVLSQLEVLKAKSLAQAAKMKDAGVSPVTVSQIAAASPTLTPAAVAKTVATLPQAIQDNVVKAAAVILFLIFAISAMVTQPAAAQGNKRSGGTVTSQPAFCDPLNLIPGCRPNPFSAAPATDSDQPCDITILTKLTPTNLVPTIKKCISNGSASLADGADKALASAKVFTQTGASSPSPDNDAINCLSPAAALFRAGEQTAAVPEVPAVLNPDGTVKTQAVPAVPAKDPSMILLFEKFSEFELAGGITSCQTWFNRVNNAALAGAANAVGSAATVGAAAALVVPK